MHLPGAAPSSGTIPPARQLWDLAASLTHLTPVPERYGLFQKWGWIPADFPIASVRITWDPWKRHTLGKVQNQDCTMIEGFQGRQCTIGVLRLQTLTIQTGRLKKARTEEPEKYSRHCWQRFKSRSSKDTFARQRVYIIHLPLDSMFIIINAVSVYWGEGC